MSLNKLITASSDIKESDKIRLMFDQWAEGVIHDSYDKSVKPENYFAPKELSDTIFERSIKHNQKIIDFACGTGLSGLPFIRKGYRVDGLDLSNEMIKYAKIKGYKNIWNLNAATDDVTFLSGYGVALCVGCIGDYVAPAAILPKMIDSLKQESIIGFTVLEHKEIKLKYINELLIDNNFSNIESWKSLSVKPAEIGKGYKLIQNYHNYFVAERR